MLALLRSAAGPVRRLPPVAFLRAAATSSSTPTAGSTTGEPDLAVASSSSSEASTSTLSSLPASSIPEEFLDPSTGLMLPPALLPRQPLPEGLRRKRPERIARDVKEEVDRDHPLWAFFRRDSTGEVKTIERYSNKDKKSIYSGRPFEASELRLKSFDELHTLWFLLLREKNIYYTQMAEAARRGVHKRVIAKLGTQAHRQKIQTAMARIKYVLAERSNAYAAVEAEAVSLQNLRDQLGSTPEGDEGADDYGFQADIIAGRQLPEPKQVRELREKLRQDTGRHGRIGNERRARLPKRGDKEEAFTRRVKAGKGSKGFGLQQTSERE